MTIIIITLLLITISIINFFLLRYCVRNGIFTDIKTAHMILTFAPILNVFTFFAFVGEILSHVSESGKDYTNIFKKKDDEDK